MAREELSLDQLTQFGIVPADEGPHPHSPDHEWWNESYFWDWFDERGEHAGHCRIGFHPNQDRAWLWFFLYNGGEWVAIEEPRLPMRDFDREKLRYEGWGLRFDYEVTAPLRAGRLCVSGFGRVVSGPRAGMVLPMAAELEIEATGPAHSSGASSVAGYSAEGFVANRFEQPIRARGTTAIGSDSLPFAGRGERDHSWGPRPWNMEWIFMVLAGEDFRVQCAEVRIPGVPRIATGYLSRGGATCNVVELDFRLAFDDACVTAPVSGSFSLRAEDDSSVAGSIQAISAAEIDITHTFVPPQRSIYRRALIRSAAAEGGQPALGWIEFNRLLDAKP